MLRFKIEFKSGCEQQSWVKTSYIYCQDSGFLGLVLCTALFLLFLLISYVLIHSS